jgi:hypothetical protein
MRRAADIAVAVGAPLVLFVICVPAAQAQDAQRVYQVGEGDGGAVVEMPAIVHRPPSARFAVCQSNEKLRSVGASTTRLIGADGSVQEVTVTKVTVWVADGDGKTLINESDAQWKDFTPAIEEFKKQVIEYFRQERYRPATLRGKPVVVRLQSGGGVTVSCPDKRN